MLPPALKHGSKPRALRVYRRAEPTLRLSRITPVASTLQTRTFCGRRRDEHRRHNDPKRPKDYNHELESWYAKESGKETKPRTPAERPTNHGLPDPIPPPEPSRRERLWQQRMEYIRKAINEDPYEALFGQSNRLLGRFGKRNWPLDIPNWWRKEIETFKEPIWKRHMASWRFDIIGSSPTNQATKETSPENKPRASPVATTESKSRTKGASAVDNDQNLEYDPISNRMIRRGETGFSHYGQDLDAGVDIPVKQFKPPQEAQSSLKQLSVSEKVEKAIQNQTKQLQTALDRYSLKSIKIRQPSFSMLKEEPHESQPPIPESENATVQVDEDASSNVRAEYDQYKAARFPSSKFARDDWLVQEGFLDSSSATPSSSLEGSSLAKDKRFKLEKEFQDVHSVEKEMAENPLLDSTPWKVQRSKGTEIPGQEVENMEEISSSLKNEWSNESLDQQKIKPLNSEVQKDIDSSAEIETSKEKNETSTRHVKLAPESEIRKTEEAARAAMSEIMTYNMLVAKGNLGNKEADAKKEMANNRVRVAKVMDDARADIDVLSYQMQVAKDNLKNRLAVTQKESVDYRARIAEAIEEARAHAEILDLNFSKMGHRLRVSHIRKLQEAKERVQDLIRKLEESRQADYVAHSVQKQLADLKEIQGAGMALAKLAGEFEAKVGADSSHVDQAYANVMGASGGSGIHQAATTLPSNDAVEQPTSVRPPRRVPSLADFFGYTPKKDANTVMAQPRKHSELVKAQSSLEKEIAEQKAAMEALETPRIDSVATTSSRQHGSAWPVSQHIEAQEQQVDDSEALTREIRGIYETKYGKITTSHVQPSGESNPSLVTVDPVEIPSSVPAPAVESLTVDAPEAMSAVTPAETVVSESTNMSASSPASVDTPEPIPATALAEQPTSTVVTESLVNPASSPADTITDTPVVPYTLLAYDSSSQSITRASFSSPPQASESIIPLTIALKHLHHPAKFLPLVQELRNKGYEPIHGEKNMLILRQMQPVKAGEQEAFEVETVGVKDEPRPRLPSWGATSGPRRTEEVFSGASQSQSKKERKGRKRAWRRAVRRAALGVTAVGGTIYVAGVMAEMTKVVVG
jgi:hypothetical protein